MLASACLKMIFFEPCGIYLQLQYMHTCWQEIKLKETLKYSSHCSNKEQRNQDAKINTGMLQIKLAYKVNNNYYNITCDFSIGKVDN